MSSSTNNLNTETTTSNIAIIKDNRSYIKKFGLSVSVAQPINSSFILNDVHINNLTTALDIEFNSWVFNFLKSYQLDSSLVIHMMLEVFREEFHGWGYTEFSKLNQHMRSALKKTFMVKGIYIGTYNDYINQRLANFVINEQLPDTDKNNLFHYKLMYLTSKAWLLLELRHSHLPQQFM